MEGKGLLSMDFLGLTLEPITPPLKDGNKNIFVDNIVYNVGQPPLVPKKPTPTPKKRPLKYQKRSRPAPLTEYPERQKRCFFCGEHAPQSRQNRTFAVRIEDNIKTHSKYSCHHRCLKKYYSGGKYLCLEWPNGTLVYATVNSKDWKMVLSAELPAAHSIQPIKVPETAVNLLSSDK